MKWNMKLILIIVLGITPQYLFADSLVSQSPDNAQVYFVSPIDKQSVSTRFIVRFGLSGMGVSPAGLDKENTGHHHLLIDVDDAMMPDMRLPLPSSDNVKHFGGGQTEATLSLSPGEHTLQLLLANYLHIPHDKPVLSEKITVFVK